MRIGILVETIEDQSRSAIRNFSANAIKAAQGKHFYEITSTSSGNYDYLVKFKKDILIVNANEFVGLFENSICGAKIENDELVVTPKFTVASPISFDSQIKETYKLHDDSNFKDWIFNHLNPNRVFWAYNSERFVDTDKTFDTVVCVGSGIIPLYLASLMKGFSNIYITDINHNCLDFQQALINGIEQIQTLDQYKLFVDEFAKTHSVEPVGYPTKEFEQSFNNIITNLNQIKNCKFHFIKGDLRVPEDSIRTAIKDSNFPLVYFSNIFSYVPTFAEGSTEQDFVLFLNILIGSNLNVSWHGDTPNRVCSTNIHKQSNEEYHWKINIDLPYEEFYQEILELEKHNLFVDHRTRDGHRGTYFNHGWYSFCIHGLDYDMTQGHEHYGYTDENAPYDWTKEALEHCPKMVQWFKDKKFKDRYHRVRIMKLSPGGIVGMHNDNLKPKSFATNMAVNNPNNCEMHFFSRDYQYLGLVPWTAGDVYKIQIGLNHYVVNKSDENRYHFIIHGSGGYL
jgi:hypothetical protein